MCPECRKDELMRLLEEAAQHAESLRIQVEGFPELILDGLEATLHDDVPSLEATKTLLARVA